MSIMEVDGENSGEGSSSDGAAASKGKRKRKDAEPSFVVLSNPSRVTALQQQYISFPENARYVPVTIKVGLEISNKVLLRPGS